MKTYKLLGADGAFYESETPGRFGGNSKLKIYGRLDCPSALATIRRYPGSYEQSRVFFADEATALAAGYRPCGNCLRDKYREFMEDPQKYRAKFSYTAQNKAAWEYDAYDFWVKHNGSPEAFAQKALADPKSFLKRHGEYFESYENIKIANLCGSCGKKAIPMAILGADVTIFDISEANCRYALEAAAAAGIPLHYEVCDILQLDLGRFGHSFDVVFMEGGVLHYFHELGAFMRIVRGLLKPGGRLICSDFHPFTKIVDALGIQTPAMGYFDSEVFEGEMAHARFYPAEVRGRMPRCRYRKYTLSEIVNEVLGAGFRITRFDEHPAWDNPDLPGEFTLLATAEEIS